MESNTVKTESVDTGTCGEYSIPEEYHSIKGWNLVSHDYVLDNVSDLWGRNSDEVLGIIPWEATRFETPIEDVALILVDTTFGDEAEWQLHREVTLATQSRRITTHPNVSDYFSTPDLEWALEIAKEWLEANPARTASSMFIPPDPATNDILDRFPYFVDETIEMGDGLMTENEVIGVIPNDKSTLPQGENVSDFIEPNSISITETSVTVKYDEGTAVFSTHVFRAYKPLTRKNIKSEKPPIEKNLLISPNTKNAIVSCPNMNGYYVVAPQT